MSAPPLLVLKSRSGTPTVYRMIGTTLTQIGNPFGVVEPLGTATHRSPTNRVIQFRSELYAWHMNEVRKYNSGTGDWDIVYTLSPTLTLGEENLVSGLFVFYINNVPHLGGVYSGSGFGIRRIKTTDGVTWSNALLTAGFAFNSGIGINRPILYRNVLYMNGHHNDTAIVGHTAWDPSNDAISRSNPASIFGFNWGHTYAYPYDFCAFAGELWRLATNPSNGDASIYKFSAGSWAEVLNMLFYGDGAGLTASGVWSLFAPGDGFLYALYWHPNAGRWLLRKLSESGGVLTHVGEIGTIVLPPSVYGAGVAAIFYPFVDTDTDPANPTTYIWFAANNNPGTTYTQFKWNGPAAALTQQDTGADVAIVVPSTKSGGGERVWTSGEIDILIEGNAGAVPGGERLKFRLFGGGVGRKVKFYFGVNEALPTTLMTIANPSAGVVVANEIQGLAADGVTEYQVDWASVSQGVANASRARVVPVVSV
jgi:hypothetical protein